MNTQISKRNKFLSGYSGKDLLKKHTLTEYGTWFVRGEPSDPGIGGGPGPIVGHYEGVLNDVIDMAVMEKDFWSWGGGGEITKINVQKVDSKDAAVRIAEQEAEEKRQADLLAKKQKLEAELAKVNAEIS